MKRETNNRLRLLRLSEILKNETDEDHPIGTVALIEKLKEDGISCDRSTLYEDVALLREHGLDVQIRRSTSNEYFVANRAFDLAELKILLDAVQAASFVSEKKTKELVYKIAAMAGTQRAKLLRKNIVEFATVKGASEEVFTSIDAVTTAILKKRKISFTYFDTSWNREKVFRTEKEEPDKIKEYRVNPLATAYHNENYYLLCYDDSHPSFVQYRIDKMADVKVLDEEVTPSDEVKKSDLARHKKTLFSMYSGEKETLVFEADEGVMGSVYDKFGDGVKAEKEEDGKVVCRVEVQVGPPLFTWLIGFGKKVKVLSPSRVVERIVELIHEASENYRENDSN